MKKALFFSFLLLCAGMADGAVLCSLSESSTSDDMMRFEDFRVEGPPSPVVGDTIKVSFIMRNAGKEVIVLGKNGLYVAGVSPEGPISFGNKKGYEGIEPLEGIEYSYEKEVDGAGKWEIWPSYQLNGGSAGPAHWDSCFFEVGEKPAGPADLGISSVWGYGSVPGIYSEIRYLIYNSNAAGSESGPSTTAIYLDGVLIGEDDSPELEPGESWAGSIAYSGECTGASDEFRAVADVNNDVEESNEGNNEYAFTYSCPEVLEPDLEVAEVGYAKAVAKPCELRGYGSDSIYAIIRNAGEGEAPQTTAKLYIDGAWAASRAVPALEAGEEYNATFGYIGFCSGSSDQLRVVVDEGESIPESNEGNNERLKALDCFIQPAGKPDLQIEEIKLENKSAENRTFAVKYRIGNSASAQDYACGTDTAFYLNEVLLAEDSVEPLAPGASRWEEVLAFGYNLSECIGKNDTIKLVADHKNTANETDEGNNERLLMVECPARPDISIIGAAYIPSAGPTRSGIIRYVLENTEMERARPFNVIVTLAGVGEYTERTSGIAGMAAIDGVIEFTNLPEGNYSVIIRADPENQVEEKNETNNVYVGEIIVSHHCKDGVQNIDEEDTDCGGAECVPCDLCNANRLPAAFSWQNWKGKNWVSPVKDQKQCGSCWAFSVIGAVEATYLKENDAMGWLDLSEQELVSCTEGSCLGGSRRPALEYIQETGTRDENCMRYTAAYCIYFNQTQNRDVCREECNCTNGCDGVCECGRACIITRLWKISNWSIVDTSRQGHEEVIETVKRAIACHGPLSASSAAWGHAFLVVGWDNRNASWIIKNSWSEGWGDHGYGRIPYSGHPYSDLINGSFVYVEGVYNEE